MNGRQFIRLTICGLAGGIGVAAVSYATNVATTWMRYGQVKLPGSPEEKDS